MPSRRSSIDMTDEEQREFLTNGYTLQVASNGPRGAPHLAAMWYSLDDEGLIQFTTFTKSQKVVNLQRDPHISCMVEDGKLYSELRGLVVEGTAELVIGDVEATLAVMRRIPEKYPSGPNARQSDEDARRIASKRCVVKVHPENVYSWDHRKLGGVY
jgi:PPOX class probable F420-dependent enzyme